MLEVIYFFAAIYQTEGLHDLGYSYAELKRTLAHTDRASGFASERCDNRVAGTEEGLTDNHSS